MPEVYDPQGKPWIKPENASVEALKSQVERCPSGALTYKYKTETEMEETQVTECNIVENGPLLISGSLKVVLADGSEETKKRSTAFCRCGASGNKPYCDGSHKTSGFVG